MSYARVPFPAPNSKILISLFMLNDFINLSKKIDIRYPNNGWERGDVAKSFKYAFLKLLVWV